MADSASSGPQMSLYHHILADDIKDFALMSSILYNKEVTNGSIWTLQPVDPIFKVPEIPDVRFSKQRSYPLLAFVPNTNTYEGATEAKTQTASPSCTEKGPSPILSYPVVETIPVSCRFVTVSKCRNLT